MTTIQLLGPARAPTIYQRTSDLQACNAALVGYAPQRLPTDPVGSAILTIASEVDLTGAEVRVYDLDLVGVGNLGTELAGTESCPTAEFSYSYSYGFTPNQVWIQVMTAGYKEYGQRYTLPTRDTTLSLILSEELNT